MRRPKMTDNLSPAHRQKTMRAVKSQNTGPERRLRAMLAGLRLSGWKLHVPDLPGKPDVVFPAQQLAIFVNGCFWHRCPICHRPLPQNNRDYWERKISRNVARDRRYNQELAALGYTVLRIWEHELQKDADLSLVSARVLTALNLAPN